MKRSKLEYFFFLLFFWLFLTDARAQQKIFFKKQSDLIYFFQKGTKCDTLSNKEGNLFYLLIPDSLKPYVSIQVENGQFNLTANDSLVEIKYMKGMNYESLYMWEETTKSSGQHSGKYFFKTMVNGANSAKENEIKIEITDKREKRTVLKNIFYYRGDKK